MNPYSRPANPASPIPRRSLDCRERLKVGLSLVSTCLFVVGCGADQPAKTGDAVELDRDRHASIELVGAWMHSHEEDPSDGSGLEVYRPSDWPFGPSRGRRGFELRSDSTASLLQIAASDGTVPRTGQWSLEPDNILRIQAGEQIKRFRIETLTRNSLIVRDLSRGL